VRYLLTQLQDDTGPDGIKRRVEVANRQLRDCVDIINYQNNTITAMETQALVLESRTNQVLAENNMLRKNLVSIRVALFFKAFSLSVAEEGST